MIILRYMDLDYALRVEQSHALTSKSTHDKKLNFE